MDKPKRAKEKSYDDEDDRMRDWREGSIFEDDAIRFAKQQRADRKRMMEW